jgi:hypothetical protein
MPRQTQPDATGPAPYAPGPALSRTAVIRAEGSNLPSSCRPVSGGPAAQRDEDARKEGKRYSFEDVLPISEVVSASSRARTTTTAPPRTDATASRST